MKIIIDTTTEFTPKGIKRLKSQLKDFIQQHGGLENLFISHSEKVNCESCYLFQENIITHGGRCNYHGIELTHSKILSCPIFKPKGDD
jgi:hypothetical protein